MYAAAQVSVDLPLFLLPQLCHQQTFDCWSPVPDILAPSFIWSAARSHDNFQNDVENADCRTPTSIVSRTIQSVSVYADCDACIFPKEICITAAGIIPSFHYLSIAVWWLSLGNLDILSSGRTLLYSVYFLASCLCVNNFSVVLLREGQPAKL